MTILNERNEKTKKIIHLLTTSLCKRNCPHCCNKQYDLNTIPYVIDEELKEATTICITGGEPVLYSNVSQIAWRLKYLYRNIEKVYVYANAQELEWYLGQPCVDYSTKVDFIDGFTVSIKDWRDVYAFEEIVKSGILKNMSSNIVYLFEGLQEPKVLGNFKLIKRGWQEDFKPADDSIFRKL